MNKPCAEEQEWREQWRSEFRITQVDLADRYIITSNRESGFGRYDVLLEPKNLDRSNGGGPVQDAIIIEFKVRETEEEASLQNTVKVALQQIEEKCYEQVLTDKGIEKDHIRKYGFAFEGKKVLIEEGKSL